MSRRQLKQLRRQRRIDAAKHIQSVWRTHVSHVSRRVASMRIQARYRVFARSVEFVWVWRMNAPDFFFGFQNTTTVVVWRSDRSTGLSVALPSVREPATGRKARFQSVYYKIMRDDVDDYVYAWIGTCKTTT